MTTTALDLNKVKDIIFEDIFKLLDSFELEYSQDGDNIFMACPIHEGSDNPNGLSISIGRQVWRCWTRGCHDNSSTDIFGFVAGCLNTDSFSEVLKYVCQVYNVSGAKRSTEHKVKTDDERQEFKKLVDTFKPKKRKPPSDSDFIFIGPFPGRMLNGSPYFESRGFRRETLKYFNVNDSDSLIMRHRSIIPVEYNQSVVGFIARSTKNWIEPKYLFSDGFKKRKYLYNYDKALQKAQETKCMFLVEGQGDVWRLWESGVENAVGLFGKDISKQQRKLLLKSGVTTLIILTDNDQAGRESKIKIKREMNRMFKLIFPSMSTKDLGDCSVQKIKEDILTNLKGYY